jgi:hypothetical protein
VILEEDGFSLGDLVQLNRTTQTKTTQDEEVFRGELESQKMADQPAGVLVEVKKLQKRKWGPIQRMDRPRRVPEDGRTMLQKAQDLKKAKNSMRGMTQKTSFAFQSNEELLTKASSVKISFGEDNKAAHEKLLKLKDKELNDRSVFKETNPEVNLPSNLDVEVTVEDFPPLTNSSCTPLKDADDVVLDSWAKISSKSYDSSSNLINNDRSFLECERP